MKTFALTYPRHLLFVFALSLLSFLTLPAHAAGDRDDDGMDKHMRMADELKLNDKQRELLKRATKERMEGMRSVKELHDQLQDLTHSDNYTAVKAKELAHKSSIKTETSVVNASKTMHEFYASLNAGQKAKLKDMRKDKKKNAKGRMDRACDDE